MRFVKTSRARCAHTLSKGFGVRAGVAASREVRLPVTAYNGLDLSFGRLSETRVLWTRKSFVRDNETVLLFHPPLHHHIALNFFFIPPAPPRLYNRLDVGGREKNFD